MNVRWKTLFLASASCVMFTAGAAHASCLLTGTDGNDYLQAPNDGCEYTIVAKGGNDNLVGNDLPACFFPGTNGPPPGVDIMTGTTVANQYDIYFWDEMPPNQASGDIITNFDPSKDSIWLSGLCRYEHLTCTFIGTAPFHGIAGEVRYKFPVSSSMPSQVQADFDGDGHADFVINLTNGAIVSGVGFGFPSCPP